MRRILISLLLLSFGLVPLPLYAQVLIDSVTPSSPNLTGVTHTISGVVVGSHTNRALYVLSGIDEGTPCTHISGIVFNTSEAFTRIVGNGQDTDAVCLEIWRLTNPTVTTASVVIAFAGSEPGSAGVYSLYNVNQTTPERASTSSNGTAATTASGTVTTVSGDLVIGGLIFRSTTCTAAGTETLQFNVQAQATRWLCGETLAATTTSTTAGFNFTSSGFASVTVAVEQSTAPNTPHTRTQLGVGQ